MLSGNDIFEHFAGTLYLRELAGKRKRKPASGPDDRDLALSEELSSRFSGRRLRRKIDDTFCLAAFDTCIRATRPGGGRALWIEPFHEEQVNPNSYDVCLGDTLLTYQKYLNKDLILNPRQNNPTKEIRIDERGYILQPGRLYLGSTVEYTETRGLVPSIEGKSSLARLGLSVHATAGFGDNGFKGRWTLEMTVTHALIIFPGMRIAQLVYTEVTGGGPYYTGKYIGQDAPTASKSHQDFEAPAEAP